MAEKTDRYVAMDQAAANSECSRRHAQVLVDCPKCDGRVALHCESCKIQVTGCICTEIDRFGSTQEASLEIYARMVNRMGEQKAREKMREAGLWIPPNVTEQN